MKKTVVLFLFTAVIGMISGSAAFATNGMNLEGYGPIATGMGGASMAYDNGAAAVMNNPATLGMMADGNRLDVALGYLGPHIKSSVPGMEAKSSADAFFMPAMGWVSKTGPLAYGIGVFSQGGMGAEYDANSFMAMGSGDVVRSELGVGRLLVPLSYNITPNLSIGGTFDYVWASLDLKMAVPGSTFVSLINNCSGPACTPANFGAFGAAPWTRLDFSGGGDFTGAATGSGFAGKIGAAYRISNAFSIGAAYHTETSLGDLQTETDGAYISASGFGVAGTGKIKVQDFEWPETYSIGFAWEVNDKLLIVADIKQINWKDVMKSFKMTYEGSLAGASGNSVSFEMPQNWQNQTAYQIGLGYKFTPGFTARIGANIADNPIPDEYLNPLFPATIEDHYTIGGGYVMSTVSSIDASFTYAPSVTGTNADGITVEHEQTNAQVMYSYRF